MALVIVGLDESYKEAGIPFAYGGCAFTQETAGEFVNRWFRALDAAGIQRLHMKEIMRVHNAEEEQRRDTLLRKLAAITVECKPLLVAAVLTASQCASLKASGISRSRRPDAYGFEACVSAVLDLIPDRGEHSVQIACDLSDTSACDVLKRFSQMRHHNEKAKKFCAVLSFVDDSAVSFAQLADLYAYCCREGLSDSPRPIVLDVLETLTGRRGVEISTAYACSTNLGMGVY